MITFWMKILQCWEIIEEKWFCAIDNLQLSDWNRERTLFDISYEILYWAKCSTRSVMIFWSYKHLGILIITSIIIPNEWANSEKVSKRKNSKRELKSWIINQG
jgi:hypothetical protein